MQKAINIQDSFLAGARKEKLPLTLFLMNGFQMRGCVTAFDIPPVKLLPGEREDAVAHLL